MYGGKTGSAWVNLAMERLAAVFPRSETEDFPSSTTLGSTKRLRERLPGSSVPTF